MKLRIEKGCDAADDKLLLIPHVLPNLRELHVNAYYELPTTTQVEPKCQHTLQCLSIRERGVSYAANLLKSGTFKSLTYLRISFLQDFWMRISDTFSFSRPTHQEKIGAGHKIIACLVHLPVLTVLNISHAELSLSDMEQLHSNLPELTELVLVNACFPMDTIESAANDSNVRPSVKLKSFHLTLSLGADTKERDLGYTLTEWCSYIECKYSKITALTLETRHSNGSHERRFQSNIYTAAKNQLQRVISKLDGVEKIETRLFPFTESNVELCNKHNLQAVELFDFDIDIETQMKNLHSSKQKKHISSVSLALYNTRDYNNMDTLGHVFIRYSFDQITKIDIQSLLSPRFWDPRLSGLEYRLSLHLLQFMPSLEDLKIRNINVIGSDTPTLPPNRLKSLNIFRFFLFRNCRASNQYLEAILQASPVLETFNTTLKFGFRNHTVRFIVDLTGNKQLKSVRLEYFRTYTCLLLEHDPSRTEKYWKTLTTSIEKPANLNEYSLIDLRWNNTTSVDAYPVPPQGYN
ncbi:hypothetical protein MBANPS3_000845 [Mucor bainieri]